MRRAMLPGGPPDVDDKALCLQNRWHRMLTQRLGYNKLARTIGEHRPILAIDAWVLSSRGCGQHREHASDGK